MTTILINILCLFIGFTICSILSWKIHQRRKRAWQDEYRRLMGGIEKVTATLLASGYEENVVSLEALRSLYNGEDI